VPNMCAKLAWRFVVIVVLALDVLAPTSVVATGGSDGAEGTPAPASVIGLQAGAGSAGNTPGSGIISEDVNLYTGGVSFVLPLLTVTGRANLDLSVALQYSSHVQQPASAPNWQAQASWVGLGWSLTFGSIVANHNGTRFYSDDDYALITEDGTAHHLVPASPASNTYYLQDYKFWKITRLVGVLNGDSLVRGWEIKREDGTAFVYGDTTDNSFGHTIANRNATRYRICWGDFSGLGSAFGGGVDSVFAYQWDLARVSTVARGQSIAFSYDQDTVYLNNGTQSSSRPYTRASYLRQVTLPNGRYVTFSRQLRGDTAALHTDRIWQNQYERERLQYVRSYTKSGELVLQAALSYSEQGTPYSKSVLSSITLSDGGSNSLPPYDLTYRSSDPNLLALSSITYPSGGRVAYEYKQYSQNLSDSNFSKLDVQVGYGGGGDYAGNAWGDEDFWAAGFSNFTTSAPPYDSLNGGRRFSTFKWNGYWQQRHFDWHINADTAALDGDYVDGDASGNTCAFFNEQTRQVIALTEVGGQWDSTALMTLTSYHPLTEFVWVMTGPDYVAALVSSTDTLYLWKRDFSTGTGWANPSKVTFGGGSWYAQHRDYVNKGKTQGYGTNSTPLMNVAYAGYFSIFAEKASANRYAKAAHWNGSNWVWIDVPFTGSGGGKNRRWVAGKDWMIVGEVNSYISNGTRLYRCMWNRGAWALDSVDVTSKKLWDPHAGPDFAVFRYQAPGTTDGSLYACKWTGSSWATQDFGLLCDYDCVDSFSVVSPRSDGFVASFLLDTAATGKKHEFVKDFEWNGTQWIIAKTFLVDTGSTFDQKFCVASGMNGAAVYKWHDTKLWLYHRGGSGWDDSTYFNRARKIASVGGGESYMAVSDYEDGEADEGRFYFHGGTTWSDSGVTGNQEHLGIFVPSLAVTQTSEAYQGPQRDNTIGGWKWHAGAFRKKASFFALDKRKVCDGIHISGSDTTWDVTSYEYWGGVLDESSSYPRFHKVTTRGPFRGASPESHDYTTTWFYNDVDNAVNSGFPDLDTGEGYLKDGVAYYTVSGNAISGIDSNWTRVEASVTHPKAGTYFVRTDRVIVQTDGVTDTVEYTYETQQPTKDNGLPQCTRRFGSRQGSAQNATRKIVYDSTIFAQEASPDSAAFRDSNAVVLPLERRTGELGGAMMSKTRTDYSTPSAYWEQFTPTRSWVYRTLGSDSIPVSNNATTWDGYNIYQAADAYGVCTTTRYGLDSTLPVAEASNAQMMECAFGNFEPLDMDTANPDCSMYTELPGFSYWDWVTASDSVFSGTRSARLQNTSANSTKEGARCYIPASDCGEWIDADSIVFEGWVRYTGQVGAQECYLRGHVGGGGNYYAYHSGGGNWEHLRLVVPGTLGSTFTLTFSLYSRPNQSGRGAAYFDDFRVYPWGSSVKTRAYDPKTMNVLAESGPDNVPTKYRYDELGRLSGLYNYKGEILESRMYSFSRSTHPSGPFDPADNYTKTIRYRGSADADSTVLITYSDGLGRAVQARSQETTTDYAVLATCYDARGRADTTWKPYVDAGVAYSSGARQECLDYYDGTPGTDCQGYPYSVMRYWPDALGRDSAVGAPGQDFHLQSNHIKLVSYGWADADEVDGYGIARELRKTLVTDQNGHAIKTYTDKLGFVVAAYADSSGTPFKHSSNYDLLGRVTSTKDPRSLSSSYSYNDAGARISETTPDQSLRRQLYDKMGRLRFDRDAALNADGKFVYFKYDNLGRRIEWGRVNDTLLFRQDSADVATFPRVSGSFTKDYSNTYDNVIMGGGLSAQGRLVKTSDLGNLYFRIAKYDDFGRIKTDSISLGSLGTKVVRYQYNRAGQLTQETYPDNSTYVQSFDQAGRPFAISESGVALAAFIYWPTASLKREALLGGSPIDTIQGIDYDYTPCDWLASVNGGVTSSASKGDRFAMRAKYTDADIGGVHSYDGKPAVITVYRQDLGAAVDSVTSWFAYDPVNRLVRDSIFKNGDTPHAARDLYNYDRNGNILSGGPLTQPITYCYPASSNGLCRSGVLAACTCNTMYTYDLNGNMLKRNGFTQTFDWRNLLSSTTIPHGQSTDMMWFFYDPLRERVVSIYKWWFCDECGTPESPSGGGAETEGAGGGDADCNVQLGQCKQWVQDTTFFVFDQFGRVVAEYYKGAVQCDYFYGPTGVLAMKNNGGSRYFYLDDQVGSTRELLGATGSETEHIRASYDYYPYGGSYQASASTDARNRFGSHRWHGEGVGGTPLGLYYFGARFYDPAIMRFISPDPVGQYDSPYSYVGGEPARMVDPDGQFGLLSLFFVAVGMLNWASTGNTLYLLQGALMAASLEGIGPTKNLFEGNPLGGGLQGPTQVNVLREAASFGAQSAIQDAAYQFAFTGNVYGRQTLGVGLTAGGLRAISLGPVGRALHWARGKLVGKRDNRGIWGRRIRAGIAFGGFAALVRGWGRKHGEEWSDIRRKVGDLPFFGRWISQANDQSKIYQFRRYVDLDHMGFSMVGAGLLDILDVGGRAETQVLSLGFLTFEAIGEARYDGYVIPWEYGDFVSDLYGAQTYNLLFR